MNKIKYINIFLGVIVVLLMIGGISYLVNGSTKKQETVESSITEESTVNSTEETAQYKTPSNNSVHNTGGVQSGAKQTYNDKSNEKINSKFDKYKVNSFNGIDLSGLHLIVFYVNDTESIKNQNETLEKLNDDDYKISLVEATEENNKEYIEFMQSNNFYASLPQTENLYALVVKDGKYIDSMIKTNEGNNFTLENITDIVSQVK